ncbi:cobyric acid synthase [Paenibacillus thailandensis]|uniref:Cobyric acid synthase n=1 Tax=Paenibacillus thailandensis TaxID=393250 RepID=A0ABW5R244_9BACL
MVQGTASDVGKSIITAALCRIFKQDGWRVAPFKSQNMSLNSYVTWDGREIGRAQGMQADACGILATTDMNPILLKPVREMASQVVVHGKPLRDYDAREYRERYLPTAERIVCEALDRLRSAYDVVVLEGAGSPAEINLKDRDIVNMRMAGWADAPVILVADIDRGGVFASIVGTMELLEPEERERVVGFVINKFRGDPALLQPGLDWLEVRTGKPVIGVLPYMPRLDLEDEDSLSLDNRRTADEQDEETAAKLDGFLDIAVIRLPRISNFTDIDPLRAEPDVKVRFVGSGEAWGCPDAVIIPGSKNTVEDLEWLRTSGLAARIKRHAEDGGFLAGICGGYEMMGRKLLDPLGVESDRGEAEGLGLFPFHIRFAERKRTVRVSGTTSLYGEAPVEGYEIHMGDAEFEAPALHPFRLKAIVASGESSLYEEGVRSPDGKVWGTFMHGVMNNDEFRRGWLNELRQAKGLSALPVGCRYHDRREEAFDRLAEHARKHLNMEYIYGLLGRKEERD